MSLRKRDGAISDNRGELTPFLKNILVVASLFIAVLIVLLVIYNVVNRDTEVKQAEESISLSILKSSVFLNDGLLKLSVNGEMKGLELKKIKFIIADGTNEKNISLDAQGFETQKSFEINLDELGIDYTKKITISIKPIIKKLIGEKELKITDKISLSPTGETQQEEILVEEDEIISTTITQCNKCGGILGRGCTKTLCHSILERCYYKGGFIKECKSCSEISCGEYKTSDDCTTDRCNLGICIWTDNECIKNPECGNSIVTASANEECDDGNLVNTDACTSYCKNAICGDGYARTGVEQCDAGGANGIVCTPDYGKSCTYCDSGCNLINSIGGTCGDEVCTEGKETPVNCPADCTGCGDKNCGTGETCSSCSQDCGLCCGNENCDSSYGETCLNCPGDCGSCLKANGETCTLGTECLSGYCYVDNDNDKYSPSNGTKTCKASSQLSGVDCDDNNPSIYHLLSCYIDSDKDNYGTGSASQTCSGINCPIGKSSQGGDCYDSNANAKPGQTQYFTTDRGDGSFNYDCNGYLDQDPSCSTITECILALSCDEGGYSWLEVSSYGSSSDCGELVIRRYCSYSGMGEDCQPFSGDIDHSLGISCGPCGGFSSADLVDSGLQTTCACR